MTEHKPGEPHRYRARCEVCGQEGQVTISVEPQFAPERDERAELVADIRRRLPIVRIGYPDLADQIEQAMDRVERG